MKRFVTFALCIFILCPCLSSCGNKKPDYLTDEMYEYGIAALEIADDYLDGKIAADVAYDRLSSNYTLANARSLKEDSEDSSSKTSMYAAFVSSEILNLSYSMMKKSYGTGTDSDIQEKRDTLAKTLGK